jgi:hypothetical protein
MKNCVEHTAVGLPATEMRLTRLISRLKLEETWNAVLATPADEYGWNSTCE